MTPSDTPLPPEPPDCFRDAQDKLDETRRLNLYRQLRPASPTGNNELILDGRTVVDFSSNDYLGLARDPRMAEAAAQAALKHGTGAGASRLISGSRPVHTELEATLAAWKGTPGALIFSSGYLANLGVVQALTHRADGSHIPIYFDRLVHASLIDAVRLSGSPWRSFHHNDCDRLEHHLKRLPTTSGSLSALIISEGVFSMDGDLPPLGDLLKLCERYNALLLLDDAHGTGTMGENGHGTANHLGVGGHPHLIQTGTLSKALGSQGGFVAGPTVLIELLINHARAFIFDTALAPPSAAAALEALKILDAEPARVDQLRQNLRRLRDNLRVGGLLIPDHPTPIVPVVVGDAAKTLAAARHLEKAGYLTIAIRPPTVPSGSSRLRVTVTATHTPQQIDQVSQEILTALR
ncbi:8-amino-7-oxononanoate synthase [candidate division BRC1 bacterium HGW-BRC1-1]|nr:MAG: 8-amino-7-oxononanoate synthase [candidate division BRC1 bacterium HGW-BRC1-1]